MDSFRNLFTNLSGIFFTGTLKRISQGIFYESLRNFIRVFLQIFIQGFSRGHIPPETKNALGILIRNFPRNYLKHF